MLDAFLLDNRDFVRFSNEHIMALIIIWSIGLTMMYLAKTRWSERQQRVYIFYFALFVLLTQVAKVFLRVYVGEFQITRDLPLELCNIMPFFMPFIMLKKWRFGWSILFFWICAGTAQAMVTPTLYQSFPHYESIRYWSVHVGLPIIAIYGAVVYGWRLNWKDALYSAIGMNVMALLVTPINLLLDSNYMYLIEKPPGQTLYSILGPWPWYILSLEGVILVLFSILLIPFAVIDWRSKRI